MKEITDQKLKKYFSVTKEALDMAEPKMDKSRIKQAEDFFDMASRYFRDADFFYKKGDYVNAFGCLNYSHGWLDAGARIGLFKVKDSRLFTVDEN